jgi:hypothetical protein
MNLSHATVQQDNYSSRKINWSNTIIIVRSLQQHVESFRRQSKIIQQFAFAATTTTTTKDVFDVCECERECSIGFERFATAVLVHGTG